MDKETLSVIGAIALNDIFGQEPGIAVRIVAELGSTHALFGLPPSEIARIFGPGSRYSGKIGPRSLDEAARSYERLRGSGCSFVCITDSAYPKRLAECPDAPVLLYMRSGSPAGEIFNRRPSVAIVGTRDMSLYGRDWCRRIVAALSTAGKPPLIVSGLAIGVDITAQQAALECSLPTVGVSPVGIDDVYPRRHAAFVGRMVSTPGCALVTDYPPGTLPMPQVFLRRNRIIAGMADAVILIESKPKGGGMMTARLASGYGRGVFVLPGRIDDIRSAGCNRLLAEKIAEPIVSTAMLLSSVGLGSIVSPRTGPEARLRQHFSGKLPDAELDGLCRLFGLIRERRGVSYDELCELGGLPYPEVARLAGLLESAGFITSDMFQRCTANAGFMGNLSG